MKSTLRRGEMHLKNDVTMDRRLCGSVLKYKRF